MPSPSTRFRFKQINRNTKLRLGFIGNEVVEVTPFHKRNGRFVRGHKRRL